MNNIVRMKDIAERAGVSTVSVSKALSGQRGVSEEMRKKIRDIAREMGYRPPRTKAEKSFVSYNLGILMAERFFDRFNSFYGNLQQLAAEEAAKMKCFTMLEQVTDQMEREGALPKLLQDGNADGVIVLGVLAEDYLEKLRRESGVPFMYLDFTSARYQRDSVISDSFYGAYQLTNYLFGKGHRRIAYVGTLLSTGSITDRYLGYLKSMMEHGVQVPPEWVINDRDPVTGLMDTEKYYQLPEELPTAFVCNCDLTASYLYRKLEERGIRCPQDVSIASYDNFAYPGITNVQFTTYEVDTREMARKAVHKLIHKLNGDYYRKGVTIVTGRLIEGNTVTDLD